MAKKNLAVMQAALTRERRTNRRLRNVIEELRDQIDDLRRDLDMQTKRLAQVQAEVDLLKAKR